MHLFPLQLSWFAICLSAASCHYIYYIFRLPFQWAAKKMHGRGGLKHHKEDKCNRSPEDTALNIVNIGIEQLILKIRYQWHCTYES